MRAEIGRLAVIILLLLSLVIIVPAPKASADWEGLELGVGRYTGNYTYVPGETMEILLKGSPGPIYTVWIVSPTGTETEHRSMVQIGGSGVATITYTIGTNVDDGDYYIKVTENGTYIDQVPYKVQAYDFSLETDQSAYLIGDEMRIFWTANYLKDQTLPPDGILTLRIWNATKEWNGTAWVINNTYLMETQTHTSPVGSTSYTIRSNVNKDAVFWVDGWFNNTQGTRHQKARANFTVKVLGFSVELDKTQFTLDSLMFIDITTFVTTNQSSIVPLAVEPNCEIIIDVYEKQDHVQTVIPTIGPYTTDSHGKFSHILKLDSTNFSVNKEYELLIKAVKHDESYNSWIKIVDFTTTEFTPVSLVLNLDRDRYTSGETLWMNVSAITSTEGGSTFTYIFEARDTSSLGTLFAREVSDNSSFSYKIDDEFTGLLWVHVTVDDGQGNREEATRFVSVDYAIMLVNLDAITYLAGDDIEISYEVVSAEMTEPTIFFKVTDVLGSVVDEGVVSSAADSPTAGTFNFRIPSVPSESYNFTIYASQSGNIVSGVTTAHLFRGYSIILDFNNRVYAPGQTMAVDYQIVALGHSIMPSTFTLTYGLQNGPLLTLQTSSPEGRLIYAVPDDLDEGVQIFVVQSPDMSEQVAEVVEIQQGANPFWHSEIFDMPVVSFVMLILVLFSLAVTMRTRRTLNGLKYQMMVEGTKRGGDPAPQKTTQTGGSSTVSCIDCEKPIEVTTSRRPIELMCPHCGSLQHLE